MSDLPAAVPGARTEARAGAIDAALAAIPHLQRPLTIFVAGATGFVGRELVVRLVRAGHQLRIVTRRAKHADELLPLASVEVGAGNVYDIDFLRTCLTGCDVAINLVGALHAPGHGGKGLRRVHVEFTAALLTAMAEAGVARLLQMSALNASPQAASHYLRTKGEAEELLRAAPARLQWTIFRPSVIFGDGDSLTTRFASLLRRTRGWLPIARAGARFAPIHVADVASALLRALRGGATNRQTYELCGPEVMTLEEIVRGSAAAAGRSCHVLPLPDALGWLQGAVLQCLPGKPFTLDNFRSLGVDSVCATCGCELLGIQPASLRALAPLWLSAARAQALEPIR
ncbi:MAG TPA: complex I NDUFA9 subunit family protein [Steroidobacteraceae bacterium]|nr:complex I NDUFA9 subunit family protein [Steroidobacteraceae bacterium]